MNLWKSDFKCSHPKCNSTETIYVGDNKHFCKYHYKTYSKLRKWDANCGGVRNDKENCRIVAPIVLQGVIRKHYFCSRHVTNLIFALSGKRYKLIPDSVVKDLWLAREEILKNFGFPLSQAELDLVEKEWHGSRVKEVENREWADKQVENYRREHPIPLGIVQNERQWQANVTPSASRILTEEIEKLHPTYTKSMEMNALVTITGDRPSQVLTRAIRLMQENPDIKIEFDDAIN